MANDANRIYLTSIQRKQAQKYLLKYHITSGGVFNLLGPYVITLLILHYNASGLAIGFVSSILNFSILFGVFAPAFLGGRTHVGNKITFWMLRGLACIGYFAVVILYEKGSLQFLGINDRGVVLLICFFMFLFCFFRAFGMFSYFPIINASIKSSDQGKQLSRYVNSTNLGIVVSMVVSFLVLKYFTLFHQKYTLLILIGLGVGFNYMSVYFLKKVPEIGVIPHNNFFQIIGNIKKCLTTKSYMPIWIARFFSDGMVISFGFLSAYLKKVKEFDDSTVFLFTIIFVVAKIIASYLSGKFSDVFGARPLLFFVHILIAIASIFLYSLEKDSSNYVLALTIFGLAFMFGISQILISQLIHKNVPPNNVVNYFSTNSMIQAIAAISIGFMLGLIIDYGGDVYTSFSYVWLCMSFFAILIIFMLLVGIKTDDEPLSAVISAFTSLKSIKGVFTVSALSEEEDPVKRSVYLNQIATINETYAKNEILRFLVNSNLLTRQNAFQALRLNPFPEAYKTVLEEVKKEDSFIRDEAIYVLRYYPSEESIQLLRDISWNRNFFGLQAILSLSFILKKEDAELENTILAWLKTETIPQYRSRLFLAIARICPLTKSLSCILEEGKRNNSKEYIRFLYISCLKMPNYRAFLEQAYDMEDQEEGAGFHELLDQFVEVNIFSKNKEMLENEKDIELLEWAHRELQNAGILNFSFDFTSLVYKKTCLFFYLTLLYESSKVKIQ